MNYFTSNTYEMKREILKFSEKVSRKLSKSENKFIKDILYGIAKSKSCLISEISRSLKEEIKLKNTIERLCDNLNTFEKEKIIMHNYIEALGDIFGEERVALFDDSDISFISKNKYTLDSIDRVMKIIGRGFTGVFDRGYDDNKIIDYMDENGNYFVIRIKDNRNFIFKNKAKNAYSEAVKRKGKIRMELWFDDNEKHEVYISHTKVTLPYNKKDYELVFCYGLSEERPLILLTNRSIHSKEDVIKVVRLYFSRWRIEEYFRAKKQEYDFENIRIRSLKGINNLNKLLTIHMGHIGKLIEEMDYKLLSIKILEESKSIRRKVIVWISQFAKGIGKILENAKTGIREWKGIESRPKFKQLELKL